MSEMRSDEEIRADLTTEEGRGALERRSPIGRLVADVPALLADRERQASDLKILRSAHDSWRRVAERLETEKSAAVAERDALREAVEAAWAVVGENGKPETHAYKRGREEEPGDWKRGARHVAVAVRDALAAASVSPQPETAVDVPQPTPGGIWNEIRAERERAHAKHGETSMESSPSDDPIGRRYRILVEEVGEVAKEFNDAEHDRRSVDLHKLRKELIQVAAMAGAWADAITRDITVGPGPVTATEGERCGAPRPRVDNPPPGPPCAPQWCERPAGHDGDHRFVTGTFRQFG